MRASRTNLSPLCFERPLPGTTRPSRSEDTMNRYQLLTGSCPYRAWAVVAMIFLLTGCGGGIMFALKDPAYPVKPTSVSVITGGSEEADLKLAEYLTKELKERTTLQVMEQGDISKAIPNYPITIKAVTEKDGEVAWVDPSEKPKIEKIQARLKTNYVFVIWNRGLAKTSYCSNQGGCTNTYSTNVFGNMLEYPAGKIVSYTTFSKSNSDSVLALFRSKGYYIDQLLQESAADIVDEFIKVTNTAKRR